MERREFLSLTFGALALAVTPASVRAEDYRKSKPAVWSAHTVDDAIKAMYGSNDLVMEGVKLKAPKVASNGGAIPVDFSTDKDIKTIAVFQDANPEATVAVFTIPENGIVDYSVRIRMGKTGKVTIVADVDGKLHSASKTVKVTMGGCGG